MQAWNLLGGMEWQGLDAVSEMLGVEDVEILIVQLAVLRDNQDRF